VIVAEAVEGHDPSVARAGGVGPRNTMIRDLFRKRPLKRYLMRDQSSEGGFYEAREFFKLGIGERVRHEYAAHAPGHADVCPGAG